MNRIGSYQKSVSAFLISGTVMLCPGFGQDAQARPQTTKIPQATKSNAKPKQVMQVDETIKELSKAPRLESQQIGEGGNKSSYFALYDNLLKRIATVPVGDLQWLHSNGTPAAQVYGTLLTSAKDPKFGNHFVLEMLDNDTPLECQSGCEVFKSSVSEIGRSIVASGKYLDFASPGSNEPLYVTQLSSAEMFADEFGNEGGRFLEFLVFDAARQHAGNLKSEDLSKLLKSKSPAGRLYAAVLIAIKNGKDKDQGFKQLLTDTAKVSYQSGCKGSQYKVQEIAKELQQNGKFHNFKVTQ